MHQSVLDLTQDVSGCWKRWGFNLGLLPLSQRPIPALPAVIHLTPMERGTVISAQAEPMPLVRVAAGPEPTAPVAPLGWREVLAGAVRAVPKAMMAVATAVAMFGSADAEARDPAVVREFQRTHVCPSTGRSGKCPGHVVDHIVPLACGGADAVSNMQYQTIAEGKAKDKVERKGCRR